MNSAYKRVLWFSPSVWLCSVGRYKVTMKVKISKVTNSCKYLIVIYTKNRKYCWRHLPSPTTTPSGIQQYCFPYFISNISKICESCLCFSLARSDTEGPRVEARSDKRKPSQGEIMKDKLLYGSIITGPSSTSWH